MKTKPFRIASVEAGETPYSLVIGWMDGSTTVVNVRESIFTVKGLKPLQDINRFAQVSVSEGGHSICWGADIDMGADRLWQLSLQQTGNFIPPPMLHDWRQQNHLSLTKAAEALGISRRMVSYYESGHTPIPKVIGLALRGWECEHGIHQHP